MHLTRLLICQVTLAKGNNHASSSSLSYPYPPAKQVRSAPSKPLLRIPSWNHFPLDKSIHEYLSSNEIHTPTYIQYALLASLTRQQNNFHHIISPTGSGKTLAYMLPIADRLKKQELIEGAPLTKSSRPRALVLTTNKQLVLQCRNVGKDLSHHCKMKCEGINIGKSLFEEKKLLEAGVDVLVSTSTRLQNALKRKEMYLSNVSWLVIDEADTIFETGRLEGIMKNIGNPLRAMNPSLQLIVSSTTCPNQLRQYLKNELEDYSELKDDKTHINLQNIQHQFTQCFTLDRHEALLQIYYQKRDVKTIIFCNTVSSLHELGHFLDAVGVVHIDLHSQLSKSLRLQNYASFRDAENGVMLATDLGARGMHFPGLKRVINYDFPLSTCDYLQRVGRTGRAGEKGFVVTLYQKKDMSIINELRNASFKEPLRISNSAYGLKNREQTKRPTKFARK